jgi:hypothetical protein
MKEWARLNLMSDTDRIQLYVGVAPNGEDAESQMVLEYTARKHSSLPIDIYWMKHNGLFNSMWGGWNSKTWSTPFSGFRWAIPEACEFKGQAIYMDSDMIILGDLAELWNNPWEDGKIIQMKGDWRTCVAKWNCERAGQVLPLVEAMKKEPYAHQQLFSGLQQNPQLVQLFDRQWNNFDGENDPLDEIKILHYTDMSTQPHGKYAFARLVCEDREHWFDGEFRDHRRKDVQDLFDKYYEEALAVGMSVYDYYSNDPATWIEYEKEPQKGYTASNGFDVTKGE